MTMILFSQLLLFEPVAIFYQGAMAGVEGAIAQRTDGIWGVQEL